MRYLLLLLLVAASVKLIAQRSTLDSLARGAHTGPEDSTRMWTYYSYARELESVNLDSAAQYYIKARDLAVRLKHQMGQLKFASNYSAVMNEKGNFEEAIRVNREGLALAKRFGSQLHEAYSITNIGNVFNYQGRYDSAITYYMQAIGLLEKLKVYDKLQVLYQNIGIVFDGLKQYTKAIEYADRGIRLSRQRGDSVTLVAVLNNKATSLHSLNRYRDALPVLWEALAVARASGNTNDQPDILTNLGDNYLQQKRFDSALLMFGQSRAISIRLGLPQQEAMAEAGMANAEFKLGNYREADRLMQRSLAIGEPLGVAFDQMQQYYLAADIKAHLGQYESAFQYLLKYSHINDSMTSVRVTTAVQELEKKYETAQKDKALLDSRLQLATSRADASRKQFWLLLVLGCLVLLGVVLVLARRNYRHRQKLQREQIRGLQQEADVIRLKATLDGQAEERQRIAREMHDEIGSGLTSIIFLSQSAGRDPQSGERIGLLARQIVGQMNEIVWSLSSGQDKLEELVAFIRHNVSGMLDAAALDYTFVIPDEIPDIPVSGVQRRNIYLAVKEAVHNSIKHAGATAVTIRMDFSDGIAVQIEDNGKGMPQEVVRRFGNGLRNMRHRMEATGGSFTLVQEQPVQVRLHLPAERIL